MSSPLAYDFTRLMLETVSIATRTGLDAYANPVYAAPVSYPARVMRDNRAVRSLSGEQVIASSKVIIGGSPSLSAHDQITLPDGSTPPILNVQSRLDDTGILYVEVLT